MRYRPSGVTPLEIWDFLVGDGTLSDYMQARSFGDVLFETLVALHAGRGRTRSGGAIPAEYGDFDTVVLTGGGADARVLCDRFSTAPFTTVCSGADPFIGECGGHHLLGGHGCSGAVVDVGQSQIKISLANRRFTYPRDFDRLPVLSGNESGIDGFEMVESQRERLQEFIGDSLRDACRSTGLTPSALVVALPCEIDGNAVPGSSSYTGTDGNVNLMPEVLRLAQLSDRETALLNDAELAALSLALSPTRTASQRILVVTIGFGVGAALLETRP